MTYPCVNIKSPGATTHRALYQTPSSGRNSFRTTLISQAQSREKLDAAKARVGIAAARGLLRTADDDLTRSARDRFIDVSTALRHSANAISRAAAREGKP